MLGIAFMIHLLKIMFTLITILSSAYYDYHKCSFLHFFLSVLFIGLVNFGTPLISSLSSLIYPDAPIRQPYTRLYSQYVISTEY